MYSEPRGPHSLNSGRFATGVLAGIAAGMVLLLGLLCWKDFVIRYHLIRLRADPGYLRAAMLEPEGSFARAGLSLYLETEEGKDRLARAYLDACDAWCGTWFPGTRRDKGTIIFQVEGILYVVGVGGLRGAGKLRDDERERFIRSAAPFLAPLRGRSFRPEKNPELQVSFLPADEAAESRTYWYLEAVGNAAEYVGKFEARIAFEVRIEDGKGATSMRPRLPMEVLAAMKVATALLIEPVTTSP